MAMTGQLLAAAMEAMAGQHLEAITVVLDLATGHHRLVEMEILDLEATLAAMVGHHLEEIMVVPALAVAMADQDLEETTVEVTGQHSEVTTVAKYVITPQASQP